MAGPDDTFDIAETRSLHAHLPPDLSIARLLVAWSPDQEQLGRTVPLERAPVQMGRRSSRSTAALQLADAAVSRDHAVVEQANGGWRVRDLGSRNGTWHQGLRTESQMLSHGAVVRVGETVLLFQELTVGRNERLVAEVPPLMGPSLAMERVRGQIAEVAAADIPVLITGPSGTGKELVAGELHRRSGRRGAFVPVNCGALPRELVESELFGHVDGAFTGARKATTGLFRAAEGGTIFLDEIGELPIEIQPRLLRALATGEIRSVGASRAGNVDVRVVAATNRHPEADVEAGTFRGDLLARLAGWRIRIPALRERKADVLPLARYLAGGRLTLTADSAEALLLHMWPWNVRELEQTMAAVRVKAGSGALALEHLPAPIRAPLDSRHRAMGKALSGSVPVVHTAPAQVPPTLTVPRDRTPSEADLRKVLKWYAGNISQVASFFGKERAQVYRWVRRHDIDPTEYREE